MGWADHRSAVLKYVYEFARDNGISEFVEIRDIAKETGIDKKYVYECVKFYESEYVFDFEEVFGEGGIVTINAEAFDQMYRLESGYDEPKRAQFGSIVIQQFKDVTLGAGASLSTIALTNLSQLPADELFERFLLAITSDKTVPEKETATRIRKLRELLDKNGDTIKWLISLAASILPKIAG